MMSCGRTGTGLTRTPFAVLGVALVLSACDDQIKRIPIFKTMSWQPSIEAYEETPRTPVAGTMPIDGQRTYDLLTADAVLTSPLTGTPAELARGEELFGQFCTPCHGAAGEGDGSVVGPNRIPDIPLLNLRTDLTRSYSDGYIWGMITNGRGLMPAYKRIPADDRWYLVAHVRRLQAEAADAGAAAEVQAAAAAAAEVQAVSETDASATEASATGGGQ